MLNLNVGILGHVDSGKTSLAKVLSQVASTACFDKNPQSQARGITIDLGFSSFVIDTPDHLKERVNDEKLQFTLVDCPGHASLIRTIIGGAQIIDFMLLVIDATKGIQTQTAECLVIGELTCDKLIVVLNKIDLIDEPKRNGSLEKMVKRLKNVLRDTKFKDAKFVSVSACPGSTVETEPLGINVLIEEMASIAFLPHRDTELPFLFAVDHCFAIKGQGTVLTGTILQGKICEKDDIETKTSAESIIRSQHRTIYTAGRPPWYNSAGQQVEPFVIGICGGSASGKTTVATKIIESLDVPWVTLLSMDSFYKVLNEKQHILAEKNEYNFDHPDAFDFELLAEVLERLKDGKKVEVPIYNFVTHSREARTKTMYGANVIIFEGILTFYHSEVLKMLDMKIFVDTDADVRLARRLRRDISQRGRDLEGVLKQYCTMVQPAFNYYIAPSMVHADIIVPRGGDNEVAIQLIVQHVHSQLQLRGFKLREKLAHSHIDQPLPKNLFLLPMTPQIRGLHTFIRNRDTPRDEFIFYSKRLIRLVIEYTLSLLPFEDVAIDTPQGVIYYGKRGAKNKICGVSILRAGETMEQAVCDVCKDIRIGKILIQTNFLTGEPELYYLRLPKDIKDYKVVLMDATVATGAAAMMAIRVLLDHDVLESNIFIVSLLMAESGVHSIAYAFPQVQIITTAVDPEINDKFYVLPGIGNFGDRYFGTEPSDECL